MARNRQGRAAAAAAPVAEVAEAPAEVAEAPAEVAEAPAVEVVEAVEEAAAEPEVAVDNSDLEEEKAPRTITPEVDGVDAIYGSRALALFAAAPVNSKLIVPEGDTVHFATPDGVGKVRLDDPIAKLLPSGAWIRKTGPSTFVGWLPEGAARDLKEHKITCEDASECMAELSKLITG